MRHSTARAISNHVTTISCARICLPKPSQTTTEIQNGTLVCAIDFRYASWMLILWASGILWWRWLFSATQFWVLYFRFYLVEMPVRIWLCEWNDLEIPVIKMVCLLSTGFPYFYINNSRVSNNTRQTLPQGRAITLSCQYDQISSPNTKFFEVTPAGPTLISSSYSGQSRLFVTHTVPISEATGQHTYRCKSTNNVFVQVTIIFYGKWVKMKFLLGMTYITAQLVLFPDRIFRARRKNRSGELPIPISFKCARMLAHCSFPNLTLDVIEDCIPHCVPTIY